MLVPSTSDAHARPPEVLRRLFKKWQKASLTDIENDESIIDCNRASSLCQHTVATKYSTNDNVVRDTISVFTGTHYFTAASPAVYEATSCPGLLIFPSLLSDDVQTGLLERLFHRDLSNAEHLTNVHLFHHMRYPQDLGSYSTSESGPPAARSFFDVSKKSLLLPKDDMMHKPITIEQLLEKKLRWMTLGGQYDWTSKVYPDERPPDFPQDIADLLKAYFPNVKSQAAIVNLYSPGDTLSVHRDVSEECNTPLISISIGCEALFLVGVEDGTSTSVIRLRSGDAVLMSGASRYAWHGVPKVLAQTCPAKIEEWPTRYPQWRGWMKNKRINLNVRQMSEG